MHNDNRPFGLKIAHAVLVASILVVEDDRLARVSLTIFLSMSGYAVHEAADGESAATLLSNMPFDLVISDLHLPGKLNGIDILDMAKRSPQKTGGILISAYGSEQAKEKAGVLGALYIEKPVELKEIARIIEDKIRDTH